MAIKEGDIIKIKKSGKFGVVHHKTNSDVFITPIPTAVGNFLKNNKEFQLTVNKKIFRIDSSVKTLKNRSGGKKKKLIKLKISDIKKYNI